MRSCFEVGDAKLLMVTSRRATILDRILEAVNTVVFSEVFGKRAELVSCRPGYGGTGYLMAFENAEVAPQLQPVKTYEGSTGTS